MKLLLRMFPFVLLILSFSSCIKAYEAPPPVLIDPLVGSWYLYDASESYGNGWYAFNAGIDGVVSFYENGTAQYDDGYSLLQGSWLTSYISDGYYDEYDNYYTGNHESFQTSLSGNGSTSLDLYFDDVAFSGNNEFTGTYYTGKSVERYTFRRN